MNSLTIGRFPRLEYAGSEAINTLCTNLAFSGENVKKIMITSCHESEGKSHLSMNLMRTLAKLRKTVVLVDADMRRSMIELRFALQYANPENKPGLAHLLAGRAEIEDVLYETGIPNAYMIPVGREISNPLPLLNSDRLGRLLDELAEEADYVIVDAPPVGMVIDAAQIARFCDGSLIVVGYNSVHRQELIDAKNQMEQTGCPILGAVLNMVEYDDYMNRKYYNRSHYSSYGYYSGEKQSDKGKPRASRK